MGHIRVTTHLRVLAGGLLLSGMLACQSFEPVPASTPAPGPDALHFADPETGRRFRALDRCIADLTDESWHTTGYQLNGNFYTSSSCSGAGSRSDCVMAEGTLKDRDQHVVRLYTLYYNDFPTVYGLGLETLWVPPATGWGANFYFSEGGQTTVGEGWGVNFNRYDAAEGNPNEVVSLGDGYRYDVLKTTVDQHSESTLRDDLASYLAGPEAMRDRGLAQLQALSQKVISTISSHQASTCDPGPYKGNGIPPECPPRPLTAEEETEELTRARAYFAGQEQLLDENYQSMYAAWMQAFPLNQCWP
jgi:hypothetical protein